MVKDESIDIIENISSSRVALVNIDANNNIVDSNQYFNNIFDDFISHDKNILSIPFNTIYKNESLSTTWLDILNTKLENEILKVSLESKNDTKYFILLWTSLSLEKTKKIISIVNITHIVDLHVKLKEATYELAYKQGVFDVTSEYLHNIGNSIPVIQQNLQKVKLALTPIKEYANYLEMVKDKIGNLESLIKDEHKDKFKKEKKNIEMALMIFESSIIDNIDNILNSQFKKLNDSVEDIATTISYQQAIYNNSKSGYKSSKLENINVYDLMINLSQTLGLDININCENKDISILADKVHITNGFMNIIKNGIESCDEAMRKRYIQSKDIVCSIEKFIDDDTFFEIDIDNDTTQKEFVLITITDNGMGVLSEHKEMIFKRGFTTKVDGHGLGLHSFANFIHESSGDISIKSDGISTGASVIVKIKDIKD